MLDHLFESPEEAFERESVDSLAEWASFANARGDDRIEPQDVWDTTSTSLQPPARVGGRRAGERRYHHPSKEKAA